MTDYSIAASIAVASPPGEVMRWLVVPELMVAWILGATGVEPLDGLGIAVGARTNLRISMGRGGALFQGEIIEVNQARLSRRYHLGGPHRPAEYERIVTYDLGLAGAGTALAVTANTSIEGLPKAAARMGTKSDTASLRRSLDRLAAHAAGGRPGPLSRIGDSNQIGQAL
jgi:hypothetical protein